MEEQTASIAQVAVMKLPCPRLEFRWEQIQESGDLFEYNWRCVYSLMIPLGEMDVRSTDTDGHPRELSLEIGVTRSRRNSTPIYGGAVDTPLRDHAHAQWDCESLGGHIPIIAVCGDVATIVKKNPRQDA